LLFSGCPGFAYIQNEFSKTASIASTLNAANVFSGKGTPVHQQPAVPGAFNTNNAGAQSGIASFSQELTPSAKKSAPKISSSATSFAVNLTPYSAPNSSLNQSISLHSSRRNKAQTPAYPPQKMATAAITNLSGPSRIQPVSQGNLISPNSKYFSPNHSTQLNQLNNQHNLGLNSAGAGDEPHHDEEIFLCIHSCGCNYNQINPGGFGSLPQQKKHNSNSYIHTLCTSSCPGYKALFDRNFVECPHRCRACGVRSKKKMKSHAINHKLHRTCTTQCPMYWKLDINEGYAPSNELEQIENKMITPSAAQLMALPNASSSNFSNSSSVASFPASGQKRKFSGAAGLGALPSLISQALSGESIDLQTVREELHSQAVSTISNFHAQIEAIQREVELSNKRNNDISGKLIALQNSLIQGDIANIVENQVNKLKELREQKSQLQGRNAADSADASTDNSNNNSSNNNNNNNNSTASDVEQMDEENEEDEEEEDEEESAEEQPHPRPQLQPQQLNPVPTEASKRQRQ
jgi:hypothetical protein